MTTLQEFIHARMRELANEDAALQQKLSLNEKERAQLRAAAQAAGLHAQPAPEPQGPGALAIVAPVSIKAFSNAAPKKTIPEKTIKEAVLEVLGVLGTGLTALDLLAAINAKFDTDYPRTSLSPQLSRLKAEGKITRVGNVWSLAKAPLVEGQNWDNDPETNEPGHPTSEETNDRVQVPETNSATVEPVEEVAHDNIGPKKVTNLFG